MVYLMGAIRLLLLTHLLPHADSWNKDDPLTSGLPRSRFFGGETPIGLFPQSTQSQQSQQQGQQPTQQQQQQQMDSMDANTLNSRSNQATLPSRPLSGMSAQVSHQEHATGSNSASGSILAARPVSGRPAQISSNQDWPASSSSTLSPASMPARPFSGTANQGGSYQAGSGSSTHSHASVLGLNGRYSNGLPQDEAVTQAARSVQVSSPSGQTYSTLASQGLYTQQVNSPRSPANSFAGFNKLLTAPLDGNQGSYSIATIGSSSSDVRGELTALRGNATRSPDVGSWCGTPVKSPWPQSYDNSDAGKVTHSVLYAPVPCLCAASLRPLPLVRWIVLCCTELCWGYTEVHGVLFVKMRPCHICLGHAANALFSHKPCITACSNHGLHDHSYHLLFVAVLCIRLSYSTARDIQSQSWRAVSKLEAPPAGEACCYSSRRQQNEQQ